MENPHGRDVSHIRLTAGLAVLALVGIGIWQVTESVGQKNSAESFVAAPQTAAAAQNATAPIAAASEVGPSDPIGTLSGNAIGEVVGAYAGLQQEGMYSSTTGAQIAGSIGMGLQAPVSYPALDTSQVKTNLDTSYNAMIQYRNALQRTLKPLLNNTQPEYVLFGAYIETKQQTYLDQLNAAATNYVAAASSTAALTVPADAVQVQVGLVNSMNEFAATLGNLATHANDPIASTVLLENYNQAENDVLTAFQNLVTYEQSKQQ